MLDKLREKLMVIGKREGAVAHTEEDDGADLFVWLIALGLMLFSGYRSLHLITSTLPAEAQIMAIAALVALDAGALAWLTVANATSGARHYLALLLVVGDLAGAAAALVADTAMMAGASKELVETVSIWIVPVVVVANVAATLAVKAMSPARKARDAEARRQARIEAERLRVLDEIKSAEREAELAMLRNRAALMRQHSASRYSLSGEDGDGEPSENGRQRTLAADGADMPTNKRSKAAPK